MFRSISAALVIAAAIALTQFAPAPALAATPNVAVGAGQVMVFPFHISGAVSATATSTVRFQMPQPCDAIGFGVNSRAIVGATNTVDLKVGGVSILSGVVTVAAAGTWYEGTITTVPIADEAVVTMDINIVGTSLTDTTFVLTCARK
jgi:hypothetical protein